MSIQSVARHILTNLVIILPVALVSEAAFAAQQCPGTMALYGEWAGGFCCDGTVDQTNSTCNGGICALDPNQTQGHPVCYEENSAICRNMGSNHFYGGMVGGFCCDGALGADKDTCNGNVCALSGSTQGYPLCEVMQAECPTGQQRYGEWAGGFCCDGTVGEGGGWCTGAMCALDPERTQGLVLCPSVMPKCSPWQTRYGEWAGGFCCEGTVELANGGTCDGTICALDAARTQGVPLCSFVDPAAQGTQSTSQFFTSCPVGGLPFRLFAAGAAVHTTANGTSLYGNVTISGGLNLPEVTLADAQIDLTFDSNGYIDTIIGTARASLPSNGSLTMSDLGIVTVGLEWGVNLNNPANAHHVDAPMQDDRQYVVLHIAGGISGSYGPVNFSATNTLDTVIVIDPRDPSVYFHGAVPSVPGLSALDDVGVGLSVQGLIPFQHANTWGIDHFVHDFNGHVLLEGSASFARLPLVANGEMAVKLPSASDVVTRVGMNGTISADINFVPNIASFGFDIGNATLGGYFDVNGYGEAYFSGYASTQGLVDSLPDTSVIPTVGARFAGRLSTEPANNFLRLSGNGAFLGHDVASLDLQYTPWGVWASGNFQIGGGFRANLRGYVGHTSANLSGEAYVNIPIYGLKTIVSGSYQTINYVRNGAVCGWTTAANAAECGWENFTDQFCRTFPWLCTAKPATCRFENSCTKSVWVEQTIQEPNFNYGSFTAKANFSVTTPDNITVSFANNVCPAGVGTCSVGVEDLQTTSPKLCVTSSIFGKFCQALVINSPSN